MSFIDDLFDDLLRDGTVEHYRQAKGLQESVNSFLSEYDDKTPHMFRAELTPGVGGTLTLILRNAAVKNDATLKVLGLAIESFAPQIRAKARELMAERVEKCRQEAIKTLPDYDKKVADIRKELGVAP